MKQIIIESEDGSQRRAWLRDDVADAILFLVGKMTQELDSLPAIPDARELIGKLADALSDSDSHWLHKELLQRAREAVSPSNGEATK